jgi:acyl-CoA dehydrogenase
MILGEGEGFAIAMGRLGPGRLHHCMRAIGIGNAALRLVSQRVQLRRTFGTTLAKSPLVQAQVADAWLQVHMAWYDIPDMAGASELVDAGWPCLVRSALDNAAQPGGQSGLRRILVCRCRLTVLYAASLLDNVGNKAAQLAITAAKVATPKAVLHALDIAIQLHGAAGKPPGTTCLHITSVADFLCISTSE